MKRSEAIQLYETLTAIENVLFDLKTGIKINEMTEAIKKHYDLFHKERNKFIRLKRLKEVTKEQKEGIDYVYLTIDRTYKVPMSIDDFEQFDEQIQQLLDEEVEIKMQSFTINEFEIDVEEIDENGKKHKGKKNILTPALIKILKPYISDIEAIKHL